ncbi:hypothetical protein T03_377 [Trichinella britovi]|uniref:Uncharacterized protein n=1 Tax=Trichinella britovi TaxID=45882 RepID=A0A0V1BJL0_TRIBR|nr:hypothetical protein T03_377 [Trichinella britovi]
MLGFVWALREFRTYIYGQGFLLRADRSCPVVGTNEETFLLALEECAQGGRSQPRTTVRQCWPLLRDTLCSELAWTFLGRWKRHQRGTRASWS